MIMSLTDGIIDGGASGGRMSGLASQQDGGQFEDALRRLHALEKKLTDQVRRWSFGLQLESFALAGQDATRDE